MNEKKPNLGQDDADHVSNLLRGGAGMLPVVGPLFAELINQVIPGTRLQRIEDYLRYLDDELKGIAEEQIRQRLMSDVGIDLFEEGGYQAVRALSEERKAQIAKAVAKGLSGEEVDILNAKRILTLLRELDDGQVVLLTSKLIRHQRDQEFRERHRETLEAPSPHLASTQDEIDRTTVHRIATQKLVSLGLLSPRFKKAKSGEVPQMDPKTGMIAASGTELTPLGWLLLRTIGVAGEMDH